MDYSEIAKRDHQRNKSEIVKLVKEMLRLEKWGNEEYKEKLQELVDKDEELVRDIIRKIKSEKELKVLVFDFGGGTLDVTILESADGVFEVKSTSGDTQLGGTDMDNALVEYLSNQFKQETGIEFRTVSK